ncbi:MAG: hypothetical protein GWP09_01575 [Nitrospiraceae bacterium]|nr:hypothetical protein [Nitrospiraceae bacterium]
MKINIYNYGFKNKKNAVIKEVPIPYEKDLKRIGLRMKKIIPTLRVFKKFKNYIIIGNGGSVNPFYALYSSIKAINYKKYNKKKVFVVNTEDSNRINEIRDLAKSEDSLVVVVSKSGETSTAISDYFAFKGYKKLILTSDRGSTLGEIAKKNNDTVVNLPKEISGRFSGFTETSLVPLWLLDFDVFKIIRQANVSKRYKEQAREVADYYHNCELCGEYDLFVPIYSYRLSQFFTIISQLIHESFGKSGKGLTVYGGFAPETQHHTNQRFFGGRRNTSSLMIVERKMYKKMNQRNTIVVPRAYYDESFSKLGKLNRMNGKSFDDVMFYEFVGTRDAAIKDGKHVSSIEFDCTVNQRDRWDDCFYYDAVNLLMFFYYFSYYSALYRGVDPFNQPAVESSKKITLSLLFDSNKGK